MFFNMEKWEHARAVATILSKSTMIPEHFRGNEGNVLIALNYSERIGADPFMVMQNIYVVYGRPGIEGKLVIALTNQSGRFEPLEFEESKEGMRAVAKERKSGKLVTGPWVTWEMVKAEKWDLPKENTKTGSKIPSKWITMGDLMMRYRSATYFARVNCPEVLLGMQTKEELEDIIDVTPQAKQPDLPKAEPGSTTYDIKPGKTEEPKAPEAEPEPPPKTDPPKKTTKAKAEAKPETKPEPPPETAKEERQGMNTATFLATVEAYREKLPADHFKMLLDDTGCAKPEDLTDYEKQKAFYLALKKAAAIYTDEAK